MQHFLALVLDRSHFQATMAAQSLEVDVTALNLAIGTSSAASFSVVRGIFFVHGAEIIGTTNICYSFVCFERSNLCFKVSETLEGRYCVLMVFKNVPNGSYRLQLT